MKLSNITNRWRKPKPQEFDNTFRDAASRQTPVAGFDLLSLAVRSMR